mmetsp:Transcript_5246/g.14845  ORF Transcript_5246/g.14845 Transcript_5246/m.14845 type:complete len:251 (+) Transcript_5246:71-823(+)
MSDDPAAPQPERDPVRFDVGGRIFHVSRDLALARHPGSLLSQLARGADPRSPEPVFVEANPDLFQLMLDFHRHRKIHIPLAVSKEAVLREAALLRLPVTPEDVVQDVLPLARMQACLEEVSMAAGRECRSIERSIDASRAHLYAEMIKAAAVRKIEKREAADTFNFEAAGAAGTVQVAGTGLRVDNEDLIREANFHGDEELDRDYAVQFLVVLTCGLPGEQLHSALAPWATENGFRVVFADDAWHFLREL